MEDIAVDYNEALFWGLISLLLALFVTIFVFLLYSGLFATIDIKAGQPPLNIFFAAYKFQTGPYKNAGQLFTETVALTPSSKRCFGIYYDDPQEVEPQHLRYIVGAILAEGKEEPDELLRDKMRKEGYSLITFPAVSHAVMTSFPYKNTLSIFIAILRIYPKLAAYIKKRRLCAHPCIEVYENDKIHFIMPLAKQDDYYVPQALDASITPRVSDIDEVSDNPQDVTNGMSVEAPDSSMVDELDSAQHKETRKLDLEQPEISSTTAIDNSVNQEADISGSPQTVVSHDHDYASVGHDKGESTGSSSFEDLGAVEIPDIER